VFPQRVMELPITSRDSHLLHILEAHADELLSERRSATGLRGLVENQVLSMLPGGRVQMAAVAQRLGMGARSFKRHLAQEGTTFGEILDRARNHLALRMSLQQIAKTGSSGQEVDRSHTEARCRPGSVGREPIF
jgi:AraC-like DNA-binding protein